MALELRQGTAATVKFGPFVDDTDGKSAEGAVAITDSNTLIAKNGGAFAAKHETTHPAADAASPGGCYYDVLLDTTDTDTLGRLKVGAHIAGSLPVWENAMVVNQAYWDNKYSTGALVLPDVQLAASQDHITPYTGTPPTVVAMRAEMDIGSTRLAALPTRSEFAGTDDLEDVCDAAIATAAIPAAILVTPANKLATDASGNVTVGSIASGAVTSIVNGIGAATTWGLSALKTLIDAIGTKTTNLPAHPADQSDVAVTVPTPTFTGTVSAPDVTVNPTVLESTERNLIAAAAAALIVAGAPITSTGGEVTPSVVTPATDVSALATAVQLAAARDAVEAHGDAEWQPTPSGAAITPSSVTTTNTVHAYRGASVRTNFDLDTAIPDGYSVRFVAVSVMSREDVLDTPCFNLPVIIVDAAIGTCYVEMTGDDTDLLVDSVYRYALIGTIGGDETVLARGNVVVESMPGAVFS